MAAKELPAAPVGNAKARKDKNSNFQRQLTAICEAVEPMQCILKDNSRLVGIIHHCRD